MTILLITFKTYKIILVFESLIQSLIESLIVIIELFRNQ
jgi:hypothetical protein